MTPHILWERSSQGRMSWHPIAWETLKSGAWTSRNLSALGSLCCAPCEGDILFLLDTIDCRTTGRWWVSHRHCSHKGPFRTGHVYLIRRETRTALWSLP